MKDQRGAVLIWILPALIVLFGIAALVIDAGSLYVDRRRMVTAADAAALAGAQEMVLSGSEALAAAAAEEYAAANGADFTGNTGVRRIDYRDKEVEAFTVTAGCSSKLYFAGVLGITGSEVSAAAAATWGYPIRYGNILPIFYILSEGDTLPEGEQLLLWDELAPGNWGFLDLGSGMKTIREILAGAPCNLVVEVGETIQEDTKPGNAQSRIDAVEERMQAAADPESGISMTGVIPIVREIEGQGKTPVEIVGFAPYEIVDIITEVTKEEHDLWYGRGSIYAHLDHPPKLYGGYAKHKDVDDNYPKGTIIGCFIMKKFIPASHFDEISQDPVYDFGLYMTRLIR